MNWLSNFMTGRYGTDQLSLALLILGMILTVLGSLFKIPWLTILSYLPFLLCLFRIFSPVSYTHLRAHETKAEFVKKT